MSMNDHFHIEDHHFVCAHGHTLKEWQSKDLDCSMSNYAIVEGSLHVRVQNSPSVFSVRQGVLVETHEFIYQSYPHTGSILLYTHCDECDPIYFESENAFYDHVSSSSPWVEYEAKFNAGKLTEVLPIRVESREDVKKRYPTVLPDDDRIVRRALEKRKKRGSTWLD